VLIIRIAPAEPGALIDSRPLWTAIIPGTFIDSADSSVPVRRGGDIFHPPRSLPVFFAL
jgi:hypothetical protein